MAGILGDSSLTHHWLLFFSFQGQGVPMGEGGRCYRARIENIMQTPHSAISNSNTRVAVLPLLLLSSHVPRRAARSLLRRGSARRPPCPPPPKRPQPGRQTGVAWAIPAVAWAGIDPKILPPGSRVGQTPPERGSGDDRPSVPEVRGEARGSGPRRAHGLEPRLRA